MPISWAGFARGLRQVKYVAMQRHPIREAVGNTVVIVEYTSTLENKADIGKQGGYTHKGTDWVDVCPDPQMAGAR